MPRRDGAHNGRNLARETMKSSETAIEVKVGALVIFALTLLVGFVLVLGDFSLGDQFEFSVEFNNAGGLKPGADVAIAGLNVGNVSSLRFIQNERADPNATAVAVRATIEITPEYADAVRENSQFFITTRGVLGEPYIEIVTRDFDQPPVKAGAVLRGVDPPRLDIIVAKASELLSSLNDLLDDPEIQTKDLISNTASLMKNLDRALVDNREHVDTTFQNVAKASGEANQLLGSLNVAVDDGTELRGTLRNANATAGSASRVAKRLERDIDPIMADVTALTTSARNASESADKLLAGNEGKIQRSIDNIEESTERLSRMSGEAETVVAGIKKGEGTVGALLTERELYDDLKEILRDIKQRPWKIIWKE